MIINVIITGNLLLLKDFIGFNDSQQNVLRVKQAMRLLVKNISRYYKRRNDDNKNEPNQSQTINGEDQPQVLIPFDVYSSKVLENIDILIRDSNKFRSNQMKKKLLTTLMLFTKWFTKTRKKLNMLQNGLNSNQDIHKMLKQNITSGLIIEVNNVEKRSKVKIERMQDIKGLIQIYLGLNKGRWVNIKRILEFIRPCNL